MKTIAKGTKVYWNDPVYVSSGYYEVLKSVTLEDDDTPILIGNIYSEVEVYFNELDFDFIERNSQYIKLRADVLFKQYVAKHTTEPEYANCKMVYLDDGVECDVKVKLSPELGEDDDEIFFYFSSIKELTANNLDCAGEFIITDIYELI